MGGLGWAGGSGSGSGSGSFVGVGDMDGWMDEHGDGEDAPSVGGNGMACAALFFSSTFWVLGHGSEG